MEWIFEKLAEFIMEGIGILMAYLASMLVGVFKLSGLDTLDFFFNVFNGNPSADTTTGAADAGLFSDVYRIFLYTAIAIIFLNMIYQIFKAFFGPLASAEAPTRTVLKSILFCGLAAASQVIVAIVFEVTQIPYDAITTAVSTTVDAELIGQKFMNNLHNTSFGMDSLLSGQTLAFSGGFWSTILSIILFFMLIKQFMALALELAERYLILGLLTLIGPLCIACGAIRSLQDVFKNWLSWIINGCIVMTMTTLFLAVFIQAFSATTSVPYLLLWIAWMKTGQKIDEHMNALGLKTAKTGGFGLDVMHAMHTGLPMALGMADKATGTRTQALLNYAKGGFKAKDKPAGFGLMANDKRLGESRKGLLGVDSLAKGAAKAIDKKTGTNLENKLNNAEKNAAQKLSKLGNGANNWVHGKKAGTDVGERTGISKEQLMNYAKNPSLIPARPGTKEYDDMAKDLAALQGGKKFAQELENKGYQLTKMEAGKDGTLNFEGVDKEGNKMVASVTDTPPIEGSGQIKLEREDGEEKGLSIGYEEGNQNRLELAENTSENTSAKVGDMQQDGTIDGTAGNSFTAAIGENATDEQGNSAADFNMAQLAERENVATGELATVTLGDKEYALGEESGGIIAATATDGSGDTEFFQKNDDNSLSRLEKNEDGTGPKTDANGTAIASGDNIAASNIGSIQTATDANGDVYKLSQGENGMMVGTSITNSQNQAVFESDGNNMQKTMQSVDMQAGIQQTADGYQAQGFNGKSVNVASDSMQDKTMVSDGHGGQSMSSIDKDSNRYLDSKGTTTTSDTNGRDVSVANGYASTSVSVGEGESRTSRSIDSIECGVSNGSFNIDGKQGGQVVASDCGGSNSTIRMDTSAGVTEISSGAKVSRTQDGNYETTDKNGRTVTFTGDQLSNASVSLGSDVGSTRISTTKTADVYNSHGEARNTSQFTSSAGAFPEGCCVREAGSDRYFVPVDTQRYDKTESGQYIPSNTGSYLKTTDGEGRYAFKQAQTQVGSDNNIQLYRPSENVISIQEPQNANISQSLSSTGGLYGANTVMTKSGNTYGAETTTINGVTEVPQVYVSMGGKEYALDMNRQNQFDSRGNIVGNEVYLSDGSTQKLTSLDMDGNTPKQYIHGYNSETNERLSLNMRAQNMAFASSREMVNGVPRDLDLSQAVVTRHPNPDMASVGCQVYSFADGTKYVGAPVTARVPNGSGVIVSDNRDNRMWMVPYESNDMAHIVANSGIRNPMREQFNTYIPAGSQTEQLIKNQYGIKGNVKNMSYSYSSKTGQMISYEQDGVNYAISPYGIGDKAGEIKTASGGKAFRYKMNSSNGTPFNSGARITSKFTPKLLLNVFTLRKKK